eukprot:c9688_g1_i2.p1 GENE.c9688_g1_i2~~c9688_g1_i2.p1  ORF type:complete len:113 (+),score=28.90 c9688_g1_i2:285-623(+)
MIQGGDTSGTGKGGKSIWGGFFEDEFHNALKHSTRGIVSMANKGPNTNASQFFITFSKQPHLNNKYTIVGKVISGWETLDAIEKVPCANETPLEDIVIENITIHANPIADLE